MSTRSAGDAPLTPGLLVHDVEVSWRVTPAVYDRGLYAGADRALRHWLDHDLPFRSNEEMPAR